MPPKPATPAEEVRTWTRPDPDGLSAAKRWRKASGLTTREAAAAVRVAERTLTRWEAGKTEPQGNNIAQYHRFLNRIRPKEGQ